MNSATPGTTNNSNDPPRATRRNGRPQACEPCRAAKVACDRALPTCRKCAKRSMSIHCVYAQRQSNRSTQAKRWAGEDAFRDSLTVRNPHGLPMPYQWPPKPADSPYMEGEWPVNHGPGMFPAPPHHPHQHEPTPEQRDASLGHQVMWQDPGLTNAITPSSSPNSTGTLYNETQMQFCPPLDQPPWMPVAGSALDPEMKPYQDRLEPYQQRYAGFDADQMATRDFHTPGADLDMDMLCKDPTGHVSRGPMRSRDPSGSPHDPNTWNYAYNMAPPNRSYGSTSSGDGHTVQTPMPHQGGARTFDGMYLKQQPSNDDAHTFYQL